MKKKIMWDELIAMWKSNLVIVSIAVILAILNALVLKSSPVITGLVYGINISVLVNVLAQNIVRLHNDLVWDKMIKKLEEIGKKEI